MTEDLAAGGLELLASLEREGHITPVSLTITDPDFPYEQWAALGAYLGEIKKRSSWYLGDWLNFGASGVYDERYAQALKETGLRYETLTNYAWVCRQVVRSRRRDRLPFGVHAEVASMEPREQVEWLAAAEANEWTTTQIREAIREAKEKSASLTTAPEPAPTTLSARQTVEGARSLASVRGALETTETLARSVGDATVLAEIPRAFRELEAADEIVRVASSLPNLHEAVGRLVLDARPDDGDPTFSIVSTELIDELRGLVSNEGSTE